MPEAVSHSRPGREGLLACFTAAVAAARPEPAVVEALGRLAPGVTAPWILAIGKAASPMARSAEASLARRGATPEGGLVVGTDTEPVGSLDVIAGDHPLPGTDSVRAAAAVESFCQRVPPGASVWVLLSGGATSLVAAPESGLAQDDLVATFDLLLRSGADIRAMNLIRKRLSRLAGGGLARRLHHARVLQLVVSDVPGDDLAVIGSGPLVPDPASIAQVMEVVARFDLGSRLPPRVQQWLHEVATGRRPETPKPGDPIFTHVTSQVTVSNRLAMAAAATAATKLGWRTKLHDRPITGEAAAVGRRLAAELASTPADPQPALLVWGGEPTVTLGPGTTGSGGRAQELALAAAEWLDHAPAAGIMVLAAGTDGRDGPTDAAGAIVDHRTWSESLAAGIDPGTALRTHDSHRALEAAGALVRTGPTGTNVMDLVLGLRYTA